MRRFARILDTLAWPALTVSAMAFLTLVVLYFTDFRINFIFPESSRAPASHVLLLQLAQRDTRVTWRTNRDPGTSHRPPNRDLLAGLRLNTGVWYDDQGRVFDSLTVDAGFLAAMAGAIAVLHVVVLAILVWRARLHARTRDPARFVSKRLLVVGWLTRTAMLALAAVSIVVVLLWTTRSGLGMYGPWQAAFGGSGNRAELALDSQGFRVQWKTVAPQPFRRSDIINIDRWGVHYFVMLFEHSGRRQDHLLVLRPALLLVVLAAFFLMAWSPGRFATRAAARQAARLCPRCGYDLRATPERCPECGGEVVAA